MLSPRWRKVIRDIWQNKARTMLVVLAIAVGVQAFAGVFITRDVLLNDIATGYQATNPASITLSVSDFDNDLVQAVRALRQVEDAEGRAMFAVKTINGGRDYNLDIYAVDDYQAMHINRIRREQGAYPPSRREILLERTALEVLNIQPGDMLTIELSDGKQYNLQVSGTVHDYEAIPAGLFPQLTGFVSRETLHWLGHSGMYTQLRVIPSGHLTDVKDIEAVAEEIKERVESYGYSVGSYSAQEPGKHWAVDTTRTFTTILSGIGLFSLILSAFLVLNTISAVLTQQRQQIGMMKAIGATGRQVTTIYLMMVAIFGVLALLVALPLGLLMAWVSTGAVARFLNIDILNFHLPVWVLGLELVAALVAPLAGALVPIITGTRITVHDAISDYGIGTRIGQGFIDRLLARVRGLPRPTLLSLRNTFRRKGRLFLTLGTLTLSGAIFIAVINVRGSLMIELDRILRVYNFDAQLYLDTAYPVRSMEREALRVPGVTSAEGWAYAQAERIRPDGTRGSTVVMFGPPIGSPFIEPTILAGRWLQPGDQNAIVVGNELIRDEPDVQVGDTITLEINDTKRDWQVVGIISVVGDSVAYANFDYLSQMLGHPGKAYALFVGTEQHDGAFQQAVAGDLEERLKRSGFGVSQALTTDVIIGASVSQFNFLIAFLLAMAIFMAIVGGLGLAGTMSLNVLERTREIGVMRAIGAANGSVRGIVMTEGVLIGLISWLIGALFAIPASYGFSSVVGNAFFERAMSYSYSIVGLLAWLVLVVIIAAIASLLPARRAASISVREALAYE